MQTLPYTAQLLPTLAAFGGCEYRERRLGQTAFVVFRKMLIINDSALVEFLSYTDIGRHINKLINVS